MVDEVSSPLDASHLRESEDVGHASADARVEGTPKVDLTVGAQEGETDPRLRPGSEGDERVKIGVKSAAQIFVVPGGVHDCSPAGTCLHGITCPGSAGGGGGRVRAVEAQLRVSRQGRQERPTSSRSAWGARRARASSTQALMVRTRCTWGERISGASAPTMIVGTP